jgi:uncharacterized membrane protein
MAAILIKLIFIVLAFLGFSNLVLAIAADVGVTVVVILISLNLMQFENTQLQMHIDQRLQERGKLNVAIAAEKLLYLVNLPHRTC